MVIFFLQISMSLTTLCCVILYFTLCDNILYVTGSFIHYENYSLVHQTINFFHVCACMLNHGKNGLVHETNYENNIVI